MGITFRVALLQVAGGHRSARLTGGKITAPMQSIA
jgi:hypothetical protein